MLVFHCRKVLEINCRKLLVFTCFLQEPTTTFNYYDDPKDNLAFERCIEVMSRLMMKYGSALLEKMEREKLDALIQAEIEPAADSVRLSKRLLGYCQLMKDRK